MSVTNNGGWIHSFTITETNTHKKGFTIYKITSIVFPRAIPQALTCISTWKRFHDVKRLYRELQKRHKSVQGNGQVPELKANGFFKRFEPEIIQARKDYIIELLDFAAQHPALYKSPAFLKFFENGVTPNTSPLHSNKKIVGGNIETICDNLDLTFEDDINLIDPRKDSSSYLVTNKNIEKNGDDLLEISNVSTTEKPNIILKNNEITEPITNHVLNEDKLIKNDEKKKEKDYSKILTPMVSFEGDDMDYIYEAALEFSHAVQAEVNLEYEEAYKKYKNGVEILLTGSKDETNEERKYIAKGKVAKYMSRADEIYDKYILHNDKKKLSFQLSLDMTDSSTDNIEEIYLERPWNQLSRFKVMQILESSVLQVQDVTDKSIYILKGIEKPTCNTRAQSIFLPQNVPYMVELIGFFQSNDKIFLLLRKAKGGKLFDYIRTYTPTPASDSPISLNEIFTEVKETKTSTDNKIYDDNDENDIISKDENFINYDSGYAELLTNYENNAENTIEQISDKENDDENKSIIDEQSFEFDTKEYIPAFDILSQDMEVNDLVNCSQKLLKSVSKTLDKSKENEFVDNNRLEITDNVKKTDPVINTKEKILEFPKIQLEMPRKSTDSIKKQKKTSIPEASIKQWARELITAMECLHSKGVILGDLHSDNILLGSKGQLLLSYFHQNEGGNPDSHLFYNPLLNETLCIAPERPLTIKSDWWSLGIVLFELLTGYTYKSCHPGGFYSYFDIQFPIDTEISKEAKSLLEGLLQQESEYRLNINGIKLHKFFEGTLWDEVAKNGVNSN